MMTVQRDAEADDVDDDEDEGEEDEDEDDEVDENVEVDGTVVSSCILRSGSILLSSSLCV